MFNPKTILTMTHKKPQAAFYERAPDIVLEKIAELNSVLRITAIMGIQPRC